jgi:hypothetical protein
MALSHGANASELTIFGGTAALHPCHEEFAGIALMGVDNTAVEHPVHRQHSSLFVQFILHLATCRAKRLTWVKMLFLTTFQLPLVTLLAAHREESRSQHCRCLARCHPEVGHAKDATMSGAPVPNSTCCSRLDQVHNPPKACANRSCYQAHSRQCAAGVQGANVALAGCESRGR